MISPCKFILFLPILHIIIISQNRAIQAQTLLTNNNNNYKKLQRPFNNSVSAIFVFGDSTVDPGNNNYINTIIKCDFPPYGRDFVNHIPTGRFSNGRLVTDYLASYVGIKDFVPPYLDPSLSLDELMTGVSFASGSSGFDPLTAQLVDVITMQKQLEYFREYKRRVEKSIGKEKTKLLISKAAFIISAGTNDFAVNYFNTPFRRQIYYKVSAYQQFLLQLAQQFLQGLINEGARVIGVTGVPPFGCLPVVITIDSGNAFQPRRCVESYSSVAREYNLLLQRLLIKTMQNHGTKLFYVDSYNPLNDMIQNPIKYGFTEVTMGCCGSGLIEASILCNPKSIVCKDPSNHMFWDSVHPSQTTYYNVFQADYLLVLMLRAPIETQAQGKRALVPAIIVFGDSTADPGNNNYTLTPFKSNFSLYGRDFPNHVATGRFTNGMMTSDFIAKHAGVKESVPPYLDQSLSIEELKTGVSFASARTGLDPLTAQFSNVIPLSRQLEYFKEYQEKLESAIGKMQTQKLIKEALYIVSIGTNDFIANYKLYPVRSLKYTVSAYIDFLLQHAHNFLQELLNEGAREIAITGLSPMGCLPIVITLKSENAFLKRDCIDSYSSIARDYNVKIKKQLNDMQIRFKYLGTRIAYLEVYESMNNVIQRSKSYDGWILSQRLSTNVVYLGGYIPVMHGILIGYILH